MDMPTCSSKQFQCTKLIGEGAYAKVYQGQWEGQLVAIKKFKFSIVDEEMQQQFRDEAKILFKCHHPSIVRIYTVCTEPENSCFILEYISNSLDKLLRKKTIDLPWYPLRLNIALDIARGLNFLHSNNIIHRDLKSSNILVDENFKAKICDFGLAEIKTEIAKTTKPTELKEVTLRWTAPEVLSGDSRTKAADIYSFGMILWEISSRKVPFHEQENERIVFNWIASGKTEKIPSDSPISLIIVDCWKVQNERPSSNVVLTYLEFAYKLAENMQKEMKSAPSQVTTLATRPVLAFPKKPTTKPPTLGFKQKDSDLSQGFSTKPESPVGPTSSHDLPERFTISLLLQFSKQEISQNVQSEHQVHILD